MVKTQWSLSLGFEILMQMLAPKSSAGGGEGLREETLPLISIVNGDSLCCLGFLTHKMGENTSICPSQSGYCEDELICIC